MVVTENDGVYCWGMADYIHSAGNGIGSMVPEDLGNAQPPPPNHIADESGKCLSKPKRVCPPELKVLQAQVGQGHILLLSKAGDVYAWGQGSEGEIGCGVKINVHVPRLVMSGKNVADITVGRYHNACVTEYGLIYSWGAGEHGQLGHAAEQCETLPRLAESMLDCVAGQIACGEQHTAVLTSGRGMQIMAGCAAWRSQEESELRIKQQMAAALPLGIGARELLSIGPTVRTYVDLFVEERERRQDGTLKGVEIKEKDKEVKIESKEKIVEEAKAALSRIRDLDSTVQGMNGPDGVGSEQAGSGGAKSEKSVDSGSEEEFDDRTLRQVGKLHGDAEIDDVSEATHQLLHVKTVTRRLKSTAQLAEEARQRAQALKAETERQETELAKAKLESWAKRAFKEMDANNDNSLTLEELGSGIAAESKLRTLPAGLQYTDGKDLFNAIDVDHDGKVTEDEFVQEVLRVCNLEDAKRLTTESGAAHVLASAEVQIHGKIKRGMPGMATSSKGKAKHRGKGKQVTPRTRTDKGAADGLDDTRLRPTPPGRIHDPKMRAGDEKILVAFFAEFQPEFATPKHVQQIIRFYAEEHARKSRISPMSSATAGGGDYRELLRTEYRRQRGVDPWEWYESVRHAQSAALADSSGQPNSTAAIKERFARSTARTADSARKQARARRVQAAQARKQTPQGQDNRSVSPDEATKKAMANVSSRKFSSPRTRAGGKIRSNSAAAPAKDDLLTPRPLDVGSAMTARTVTLTAPTGDTTVKAPVLPGVATTVTEGSGEPGASPRMTRRAKSARLVRERRTQMTRSAYHARSHTSAADRVIFKGVQDLRNKGTKAKDHWVAIFSPLGPRSDFMRQAGDILVDSRRSLAAGRGATERSTSRIVGKVSLLRSKLDKSKTVLERKREKLQSLKAEHANLVSAIASEEEALKAEHAEEARTSTLLETVHTRLMEASENHEELTSTYVYMKEHLLSMQLLQKERSDELRAAERLHGTLVALKDRSETMAAGVMHEVKGLREDNAAVRAQFQQALEQYGSVQKRSRECADETYKIVQQRARDRREREKQEEQRKHKKLGKSVGSNLMSGARQKAQMARARRCQQVLLQLREHIGDIDIDNPAHVDNIIEKYKSMSSGDEAESGSSARLVNMALLEDRQLATRRIEMLKRERDGLIDILRAGFESVHRDSDGVENADTYCVSPITYQLIYQDEPLLALYENYTSVQLLLENGEEWGITDSSLVWSEQLGAVHTSRRNGWLPWGEFKSLRKRGNANIETCVQLRCGHPSRTTLPRNEAERRIITSSLERAGEAEQRRARLMSEIQTSLSIVSMMKPLGEKSKLWIDKQPSPASTADLDLEMSTQQPFHTEVPLYALVFAIGRKLGLEYTTEQDTNDPNVSPRARKLAQAKLPSNYGENLLAVLRLALDELEIDCTLLGDFDDLRTGKAQSVRDVVAQICHHPKIAIRTGWREYKEIELLDDNLKALESLDDEPVDDWTSQWTTEQMEPLSCIVNLEQTLSLLLNSLAAGDRLKKALGTQQEHRLTQLLQQSETQLRDQAHRHPSCAITKVTLRDYCLNGGEEIFDPAAQPFEATSAAAVAGDTLDSQSPSDMVNDAAEEVRKAELRAAYLAWDVATVDYDALLENIQLDVEYKTNVTATFHGAETKRSRSGRNHVAAVCTYPTPFAHRCCYVWYTHNQHPVHVFACRLRNKLACCY